MTMQERVYFEIWYYTMLERGNVEMGIKHYKKVLSEEYTHKLISGKEYSESRYLISQYINEKRG